MKSIVISSYSLGAGNEILRFSIIMQTICLYFESVATSGINEIIMISSNEAEGNLLRNHMDSQMILSPGNKREFFALRTSIESKAMLCDASSIPRDSAFGRLHFCSFIKNGFKTMRSVNNLTGTSTVNGNDVMDIAVHASENSSITLHRRRTSRRFVSVSSDDEDYDPASERKKKDRKRHHEKAMKRREYSQDIDTSHFERQRRYRKFHSEDVDTTHIERQEKYRTEHPDTVGTSIQRRRSRIQDLRDTMTEDHSLDEPEDYPVPGPVTTSQTLGERNNICPYCWAIHFPGAHVCCSHGQIFIPPFKKQPEPLNSLFYSPNDNRRSNFLRHILSYNTLFSMASIQYTHVGVAKFGVQVARAQGAVHHMVSAVRPNYIPNYGNYYIYDGQRALEERMNNQSVGGGLRRELVADIGRCMDRYHPFARYYKRMEQLLKQEEDAGHDPRNLRLRVVNAADVTDETREHRGIYATDSTSSKDFVALFYSCDVEQEIRPRGLTIYPKLGKHIPRPLFHWAKEVNAICYPLIFPRGDFGFFWKGFERVTPMPFQERLDYYVYQQGNLGKQDIDQEWDPDTDPTIHIRYGDQPRRRDLSIPCHTLADSIEETGQHAHDQENEQDNDIYDNEINETIEVGEQAPTTDIIFVERDGNRYPQQNSAGPQISSRTPPIQTDEDRKIYLERSNGDDEEDEISEHSAAASTSRHHTQDQDKEDRDNGNIAEDANSGNANFENLDDLEWRIEHHHREYASNRDWALYVCQDRKRFKNRISAAGKLGQLFIIDQFTRIQHDRLQMIEKHHSEFLTSTKKKLLEAVQRAANRHHVTVGSVTSIPTSMPGSPRYLRQKYEDAVEMARVLGKPDLFITFTANVNWPDIKDHIPPNHTWADYPFLVNEVFKKKMEAFLDYVVGMPVSPGSKLRGPGCFGQVKWYTFSIEFQQRGPPHMHLILSLVNHIRTVRQVDAICSGELPIIPDINAENYAEQVFLREKVEGFMVHTPCENDTQAYCNKNRQPFWKSCGKHFPKEFSDTTSFGDSIYPRLRRPKNNEFVWKRQSNGKEVKADNSYVVSYSPVLLTKFDSHINVEVIASITVFKYIFKYLFKGFDRALVETIENIGLDNNNSYGVTGEMIYNGHIIHPNTITLPPAVMQKRMQDAKDQLRRNNVSLFDAAKKPVVVYNETHWFEDMRATTANEAAWIIAANPRDGSSHMHVPLCVHVPDEEPIRMEIDTEEEVYHDIEREDVKSRLKAWFELNSREDEHTELARSLTFNELPKYFVYRNGKWVYRKRDYSAFTLGRIKFVRPRYLEHFAIRLLCMHQRGVKSFEELRTVDDMPYENFVDAATGLRLMNSELEWHLCLFEATDLHSPIILRSLFASILLFCAPANPLELWEEHKEHLVENNRWSEARKEAHALHHIRSCLRAHGMELQDFNLPAVNENDLPDVQYLEDDSRSKKIENMEAKAAAMFETMTDEQKNIVQMIENSVVAGDQQNYFIEGSGGSGKTFVYEYLYYKLNARNFPTICVAHTGIAASLLPRGQTAHRAFSIPLQVEATMHCKLDLESDRATTLRNVACVLWDEAPMTHQAIFDAVNNLFYRLHQRDRFNSLRFGGVNFVLGGDWRQTLPIVETVRGPDVVNYTLLKSELWAELKLLRLTRNLRASSDPMYAAWIRSVGDGVESIDAATTDIRLPVEMLVNSEQELIDRMFGHGQINDPKATDNSSILTVDNETSLEINKKILRYLPGETVVKQARDEHDVQRGFGAVTPEIYNMLTPSGLPPFNLELKVGAIVILLRNLNVCIGLTNGLRMRVQSIGIDTIVCTPVLRREGMPEKIVLHRMAMSPSFSLCRETCFVRWQFPLRLAYALTINKSAVQLWMFPIPPPGFPGGPIPPALPGIPIALWEQFLPSLYPLPPHLPAKRPRVDTVREAAPEDASPMPNNADRHRPLLGKKYESLEDDMKLAILAKLDRWTVVELHACSKKIAQFVERYYNKHVERKIKIKEMEFSKSSAKWSYHPMESSIDDVAERVQKMSIDVLKIAQDTDLDQLLSFCRRSEVRPYYLWIPFKIELDLLNELLSLLKPTELLLQNIILLPEYWDGLRLPPSLRGLSCNVHAFRGAYEYPAIALVPPQLERFDTSFGVCQNEINRILKSWLEGARTIAEYRIKTPYHLKPIREDIVFEGVNLKRCTIENCETIHKADDNWCYWIRNIKEEILTVRFRHGVLILSEKTSADSP